MRVALYEDRQATAFGPLTMLRPVFELICGRYALRERLLRDAQDCEWGAVIREPLVEAYREDQPAAHVNDRNWLTQADTLLVNGRWIPERTRDWRSIRNGDVAICDGEPVCLLAERDELCQWSDITDETYLQRIARKRRVKEVGGRVVNRPWDLIAANAGQLVRDYEFPQVRSSLACDDPRIAVLGDPQQLSVHPSADLDPFVVLDVRQGPITVDAEVRMQSFTRIAGPCFVGRRTQLLQAVVRPGTTIGPDCRVSGEVQQSVLHGFVNKSHDGYLGHSYVCPWVNLGAGTTNSDLKNDYSTVGVPIAGACVDSRQVKLGAFIGDHVKTGLGSLFNTGSSIGICAMILPAGRLLPKCVPPFCRVWHGDLVDSWELERTLETARTAMRRRGQQLTPTYAELLRRLFAETWSERKRGIDDARRRAMDHGLRRAG
ncbi:MAG: putative sugar nucleotidyl transferase [Planctomycetaceae bacterium]